jgi:hypothetical protein
MEKQWSRAKSWVRPFCARLASVAVTNISDKLLLMSMAVRNEAEQRRMWRHKVRIKMC